MDRKNRNAFTLVELLVVIGIIALLISILLPALSKARQQANITKCLANLHQITVAGLVHANDHHGYFPAAGKIASDSSGSALPSPTQMGDVYMQKYDYFSTGTLLVAGSASLLDLPEALSTQLNGNIRTDTVAHMIADVNGGGLGKIFLCPDDANITQGVTTESGGGFVSPLVTINSYNFNEDVLGHDSTDPGNAGGYRLCGNYNLLRRQSETMFLADGNARSNATGAVKAIVSNATGPYANGSYSLADAYPNADGLHTGIFDTKRHGRRINVAFFDGHCESVRFPRLDPTDPSMASMTVGSSALTQFEASTDLRKVGLTFGFPGTPH